MELELTHTVVNVRVCQRRAVITASDVFSCRERLPSLWQRNIKDSRVEKIEREHVGRKVMKVTNNKAERPCSYLQSANVIN